jgi:hypothetical protein
MSRNKVCEEILILSNVLSLDAGSHSRHKWVENFKKDRRQIGLDGMDLSDLAQWRLL